MISASGQVIRSAKDVENFVASLGTNFGAEAKKFREADVDGETLAEITLEDVQGTLGKSLKSKKIWKAIQKLQASQPKSQVTKKTTTNAAKNVSMEVEEEEEVAPQKAVSLSPAKNQTYITLEDVHLYKTNKLNRVSSKVGRFQVVNVLNISDFGIAQLKDGYCTLYNKNAKRQVLNRVFIRDGTVYNSERKEEHENLDQAMKALNKAFSSSDSWAEVIDSSGMVVNIVGNKKGKQLTPVGVEQVDDVLVAHFLTSLEIHSFSRQPELLVKRTTKNIAWNLFKEELLKGEMTYPPAADMKKVQEVFRTKKKQVSFVTKLVSVWRKVGKKNDLFSSYKDSKAADGDQVTLTVCRKEWVEKARKLKYDSMKQVETNTLSYLNVSAGDVGLLGPVPANLGRPLPQPATERSLDEFCRTFQELTERPDATYRLHRQFLRYADALTSALGMALEEQFDADLVDIILSYLDNGCKDYINNAKGSLQYNTTGSICLDFYSRYQPSKAVVLEDNGSKSVEAGKISSQLLEAMWSEHPLTALRIMFYLGSAREGKQDLYGFYVCMHWLWKHHPYTLLANIDQIKDVNYFKGMLEVLSRVVESNEEQRMKRSEWYSKLKKAAKKQSSKSNESLNYANITLRGQQCYSLTENEMARKLLDLYDENVLFRALHKKVAKCFASCLTEDLTKKHNLTLACKWCPTEGGRHDKILLMHEAVSREMFPPEEGMTEFQYVKAIRNKLRKQVLSPLRQRTKVVERFVSARQSSKLNYEHVPGQAMKKHQETFKKQDPDGFTKFLEKVSKGEAKVKSGAITPLDLFLKIQEKCRYSTPSDTEIAVPNGQWAEMMRKLLAKIPENERNIVAAVDLSGSMGARVDHDVSCTCMDVAAAMGLVCSELAEGPYKNKMVCYTTVAKTINITGETLSDRYQSYLSQHFSGGTTYEPIFNEIARNAGKLGLPARIIILSDMEWRGGASMPVQTCLDKFKPIRMQMAQAAGCSVDEIVNPEVVFWNINVSGSPARKTDVGASLISGYSPVCFVDVLANAWKEMKRDMATGQTQNDPLTVMLHSLNKSLFQKLRVVESREEAMALLTSSLLGKEEDVDMKEVEVEEEEEATAI